MSLTQACQNVIYYSETFFLNPSVPDTGVSARNLLLRDFFFLNPCVLIFAFLKVSSSNRGARRVPQKQRHVSCGHPRQTAHRHRQHASGVCLFFFQGFFFMSTISPQHASGVYLFDIVWIFFRVNDIATACFRCMSIASFFLLIFFMISPACFRSVFV